MSTALANLAMLAALWLCVAAASAALFALAWPLLERRLRRLEPARRAALALLSAAAPVLIASGVTLACTLPGLVGLLSGLGDHCAAHANHLHFCLVHAHLAMTPALALPLAALALLVALVLQQACAALHTARVEARWLARRSGQELDAGVRTLELDLPIAFTQGLLKPTIWLALPLLRALASEQRAIVLDHERAHCERRDPLRQLFVDLVGLLHLPATRRRIAAEHRLASELACDAEVVRAGRDPLAVAHTLLEVERMLQPRSPRLLRGTASLATDLRARVEALLAEPDADHTRPALRSHAIALAAGSAVLLLASSGALHHGVEHLLELVIRSLVGLRTLS